MEFRHSYFSSPLLENTLFHPSSAPPSGPRSHPRRTSTAAPSAAPDSTASQALSNAPVGSVHCPAASAPLAQLRVRGAFGQKNPPPSAEQHRLFIQGLVSDRCMYWCWYGLPVLLRGRRRVFSACPFARFSCARGVEVSGVKNVARRARFSGLAKEAQRCRRRVVPTKVRARRPTPEHRKNP